MNIIELDNEKDADKVTCILNNGSPSRTRTYDLSVNSRALYRLSYWGILSCFVTSKIDFISILHDYNSKSVKHCQ